MNTHSKDCRVAYEAGYRKAREDMVALLSQRGQELLVALISEALRTDADEDSGVPHTSTPETPDPGRDQA